MTQNEEITKLKYVMIHLDGLMDDLEYLSSMVEDTILEVRHTMSELQIIIEEDRNG